MSSQKPTESTIEQLKQAAQRAEAEYRAAIAAFKKANRSDRKERKARMAEQIQAQKQWENANAALASLKDAQFSAVSEQAETHRTQERQYAVVREEGPKEHQAKELIRNADGTTTIGQRAEVGYATRPEPQYAKDITETRPRSDHVARPKSAGSEQKSLPQKLRKQEEQRILEEGIQQANRELREQEKRLAQRAADKEPRGQSNLQHYASKKFQQFKALVSDAAQEVKKTLKTPKPPKP